MYMGRKRFFAGFIAAVIFFLTACGASGQGTGKGIEDAESDPSRETAPWRDSAGSPGEIRPEYVDAYEWDMTGIDLFCEVMGVQKDQITLNHNFTDDIGLSCFDIGIEGDPARSGTYIMQCYTDEEGVEHKVVNRQLSHKELDDRGIHVPFSNDVLLVYEIMYDSVWEKDREGVDPVKPPIDDSFVTSYKETRLGTDPIWEAYYGYTDSDGYYRVSYIGDVSDGWRQGIFKKGKWKTWQMPPIADEGPDYYYFWGSDDRIWYYGELSDAMLKVYNEKSEKIVEINTSEWVKENGMKNKNTVQVTALSGTMAIFRFKDMEGRDKCFLVDAATGKIEHEYDKPVYGECYGDYLYEYSGHGTDILKIINWKTGEVTECLDLSGIRGEYKKGGNFVGYNKYMKEGFGAIYNDEIPDIEAGMQPIRICVYEGTLYLSYFSGVYRYNQKDKRLEKILDGDEHPKFQKMYGDFDVGKNETVYLLGFLGGGDDEGACDFVYMEKN